MQGTGGIGPRDRAADEVEEGQCMAQFSFLVFSLHSDNSTAHISFPRTDQDLRANEWLGRIMEFLTSGQRPALQPVATVKRFLKQALCFFSNGGHLWHHQVSGRHQQVILTDAKRLSLVIQAHDQLSHKGFFSTHRTLADRFWWPSLDRNLKWFLMTCHECQLRSVQHVHIPPTVPIPTTLFLRVHIDTMHMSKAAGLSYIVQARCSLIAYLKFGMLAHETGIAVGKFIFNDILCHWGAVKELITNNSTPIVAGLDWLAKAYHIAHICISPYNKQANGVIERSHCIICESIVKTCTGDICRWPVVTPHIFWADRVTVCKDTGYSPFYMGHGVEPILPFDIMEATYLVPTWDAPLTVEELLAIQAHQLEKCSEDLAAIKGHVLQARHKSIEQFKKSHANLIIDYDFKPGALVLVWNTRIESDLSRKTKP